MSNPQTILVSGASAGIGRAVALELATAWPQASLILLGRNPKRLEETRQLLPGASQHYLVAADVRDAEAMRAAFARLELRARGLDAVVACAGVAGENVYGEGDRWGEVIETNLSGTYRLVNEALPALRASTAPYRHVVVVSSVLARLGVPGFTAYCAAKAGLLGLVRAWAVELARERILVNALCPGWVDTAMAQQGFEGFAKHAGVSLDAAKTQLLGQTPLQKMSAPREIAWWVRALVSPEQTSMTGQAVDVNNGQVMA
jgi:NAD(P)-dependent dehydrogenase (short-subunit alcohol dehydrogenase family)